MTSLNFQFYAKKKKQNRKEKTENKKQFMFENQNYIVDFEVILREKAIYEITKCLFAAKTEKPTA